MDESGICSWPYMHGFSGDHQKLKQRWTQYDFDAVCYQTIFQILSLTSTNYVRATLARYINSEGIQCHICHNHIIMFITSYRHTHTHCLSMYQHLTISYAVLCLRLKSHTQFLTLYNTVRRIVQVQVQAVCSLHSHNLFTYSPSLIYVCMFA